MKFKGVIFDMDGVVVDNHEYHFKAWMDFAKKYKFELNEQIYRDKFNGKTNADLFPMIFGNPTTEEMKRYADEKEGMYKEIYAPDMKAHKGLIDFLELLKRHRIKIALGTSAPPGNVDFILDPLKLRQYFDVIVDGTHVKKGKPDPEVYQLCCAKLGLEPKDCVVFEDSLAGLESGERAGCTIVGVATSHEAYELEAKTDLIIHDFTEAKSLLAL
ncbi:HAD family hydrolase [Peredibacter sp. HCB2-198]|uniref:HAD family hydrolase n=1 Tax=Peredibacter sp. HCB2-198 TaxID=3383025 RepID=UPI0038B67880